MSLTSSSPFKRPHSLRLSISTSSTLSGITPSPLTPATKEPWSYETPSGECFERICFVICVFDFSSSDSDHLSFRKDEILAIVRQEESGWWAAVRSDGSQVGWIPASYVNTLSDDAAESVGEKLRSPENGPSAPSASPLITRRLDETPSSSDIVMCNEPSDTTQHMEPNPPSSPTSAWLDPPSDAPPPAYCVTPPIGDDLLDSPLHPSLRETENPFAADLSTVVPLRLDKSLPASPLASPPPRSAGPESKFCALNRSFSGGAITLLDRARQRRPVLLDDQSPIRRPSTIVRTQTPDQLSTFFSALDVSMSPSASPLPPHAHPRPGKILQLTGDDSAQAFHNAKQAQANLPWYLKHRHGEEEIKLEFDGTVKAGTLPALVEHLVVDPLRASQQELFRRAFLVTFCTFATATEVFDLLVAQYELDVPPGLAEEEFEQWKREKLRPTQKRVLTVFTMWLEEYDLLNQDAEVAPKLQVFLSLVISPPALALTAKHVLKSLERLTFAEPSAPDAIVIPSKKRKKARKGDVLELLRADPMELAQHLSLFESDLYRKIRAQECFLWTMTKEGDSVKNMRAFSATHDRLADWVKCSILEVDILSKRANIVDLWIRVAEKCRSLNNFSSMSSIVAALQSVLISRLHFTWLNSNKEMALEPLRKVIHPASNYAYYRRILDAVEGPCVPFVGPFMKNMIYAQEQHEDNVIVQSATKPDQQFTLIHFVKRQKWYDITVQMLRFQTKPYSIPEMPEMTNFITGQMERAATKGDRWYWQRSDELQQSELLHADIRRGLEAAGF